MLARFGLSGFESVMSCLAELSCSNTPSPTRASFGGRCILELFASELSENTHLQDRWRQALRWRMGFDGEPRKYSWIADQLEISLERVKQICAKAWSAIRVEEPWRSLVITQLTEIHEGFVGRLTLEILEDEDVWFAGVASNPFFFKELVSLLSDGKLEIASHSGTCFVRKTGKERGK